jgi:hypothetical protein
VLTETGSTVDGDRFESADELQEMERMRCAARPIKPWRSARRTSRDAAGEAIRSALRRVQLRTAVWTGYARDTRPISEVECALQQREPARANRPVCR